MDGQLSLFETKPVTVRRRTVPNGKPAWRKYSTKAAAKPHQCDFCLLNSHDDALAPIPRKARYVRTTKDVTWYLCLSHANDQRVADGFRRYRGEAAR